jgi:hypothetical protein
MLCNAEMTLISAVEDRTLMTSGFEWHTYLCSGCGDTERRFVFNKNEKQDSHGAQDSPGQEDTDSTLVPEQTDLAPSNPKESAVARPVFFKRVLSKFRVR